MWFWLQTSLWAEAKDLEKSGHDLKSHLYISKRHNLIMPTHRVLDDAIEASKERTKVGTTGKGYLSYLY